MSHTPRPWEIDRSGRYYKPCVRRNGIMVAFLPDNTAGLVLETDRTKQREEDEANARLIAAAPDLLEALKDCAEYFDQRADADHNGTSYTPNEEMRALQVVRAVIARATGGAV